MLANRSIDLLMTRKSITLREDIYEEDAGQGISYSRPYLYGGLGFTGEPAFVQCADDGIKTFGNCSELKICINEESHFSSELQVRIPQRHIVVETSLLLQDEAFLAGKCNVIATESAVVIAATLRGLGYKGELSIGKRQYTSEMWALKSLDDDPVWHNFLDVTLMALLAAEQAGVTKQDAQRMGKTDIFGPEYEDMFINAVGAKGNYGTDARSVFPFPLISQISSFRHSFLPHYRRNLLVSNAS